MDLGDSLIASSLNNTCFVKLCILCVGVNVFPIVFIIASQRHTWCQGLCYREITLYYCISKYPWPLNAPLFILACLGYNEIWTFISRIRSMYQVRFYFGISINTCRTYAWIPNQRCLLDSKFQLFQRRIPSIPQILSNFCFCDLELLARRYLAWAWFETGFERTLHRGDHLWIS